MKTVRQGIEGNWNNRFVQTTNWMGNIIGVAAGVLVCMLAPAAVRATEFHFTRVADTNTPIPDGTENFASLGDPAIDNGTVAFKTIQGIYKSINNSLIPVGKEITSRLYSFTDPSLDRGNVAFGINDFSSLVDVAGVYTEVDGEIVRAISPNTTVFSSIFNGFYSFRSYRSFDRPSYDDGQLAFLGRYKWSASPGANNFSGILTNVSGLFRADIEYYESASQTPCTFTFTGLSNPVLSHGITAFRASNYCPIKSLASIPRAILAVGADKRVLVDTRTAIPGGSGNFTDFGNFGFDNGNLAFQGIGAEQQGIYTIIDGVLGVVADLNTTIPGGEDRFTSFSDVAIDGHNVVFIGFHPGGHGLYTKIGNTITPIVTTGETLDHKVVSSISIGREAISSHQIAFRVGFSDRSSGIYVATVEPVSESD